MANKNYTCKDCKKELRKKEVTQELVDLNLCPQCYTNRIMNATPDAFFDSYQNEQELYDLTQEIQ